MIDNGRHFELLRSLAASGVRFAAFGTAGLLLRHAELRSRYALGDADVLLPVGQLEGFVRWARGRGGEVTSWGEPFVPGMAVHGRFYVRAVIDGLLLDATYETFLELDEALREATACDGVPTCSDEVIWRAKLRKDHQGALAFASAMGLEVPPGALRESQLRRQAATP
ncbi:MAG: hypothetical protein JNJ54_18515 [Myxococcaceae bacterium]|nr:hypothetical protein [Myxococcaceae bacterium]